MGLDQYIYRVTKGKLRGRVDANVRTVKRDEIHYWRGHWDLHAWMREIYLRNGGRDLDFNCSPLILNEEDLNFLEQWISKRQQDERVTDDLIGVERARRSIQAGSTIFYTSWY